MRAQVKRKANALIAAIMAAIFAFSLSGVSTPALAADEDSNITVTGVDFMQPSAQGWEVLKVNDLGDQAVYITVYKTVDGKTTPLSNPMKYTADMNDTNVDKDGSGAKIAQIIAVQLLAEKDATKAQTAIELLGPDVENRATYTIVVTDEMMQGKELYSGTIYPVYANIVNSADEVEDVVLLGIRTTDNTNMQRNLGVGQAYYRQVDGQATPTGYSLVTYGDKKIDNVFDSGAYFVTYKQNDSNTVEGYINYVWTHEVNGETVNEVVKSEKISGIGPDGAEARINKSFSAVIKDGDNEEVKSFRVISRLAGNTVKLSYSNASYTVQVVPLTENTTYPVTINYKDIYGNLLWSDSVDVKGKGYRYTLPNTFSVNKSANIAAAEGVDLYTLKLVEGGQVVNPASGKAEGITTQGGVPTANASEDNGTILNLTNDLTDADFVIDENNGRVINAIYENQDAKQEVEFTLIEMNGENNKELSKPITAKIKPGEVFNYTPEKKVIDGKTYVPWAGNTETITYTWESLGQGVELLQYVYYLPEGYVLDDAYGVTVQYVNIADGSILRSETVDIDPEITNFVEISGPQSFTQNGNEYVRLAGQDTAIRHAFLSPNRTYSIYYRDVNDVISANNIVDRVQIIQTTLPTTGGGLTAAPTPVEDAAADEPAVDAGVGAGDGTVIINDDDNPLANLGGQDTSTERTIEENENPLASGIAQNGAAIAGGVVGVLALIGLAVYFLLRRRNKKTDNQNA